MRQGGTQLEVGVHEAGRQVVGQFTSLQLQVCVCMASQCTGPAMTTGPIV